MGLFDRKKKNNILKEIEKKKEEAQLNGRFSLFHTKMATDLFKSSNKLESYESYRNLLAEYDEYCMIPYEIGMYLDGLKEDCIVFFHRTNLHIAESGYNALDNKSLQSIMENGLNNNGDIFVGGFTKKIPALTKTMSPLIALSGYINLVSSYKNNDTIVLAAFPKSIINEEGEPIRDYSDIYNLSGHVPRVKTEYMIGAIIKKDQGLWDFYSRDQILQESELEHRRARR